MVEINQFPTGEAVQTENSPYEFNESFWHRKNFPIIILVIILVTCLLTSLYFVAQYFVQKERSGGLSKNITPTVSPTIQNQTIDIPDWKTYMNKTHKFEFKYPSDFEFEQEDQNRATFSSIYVNNKISKNLILNFTHTIDSQTLQDCKIINTAGDYFCLDGEIIYETINGIKFRKFHLFEGSGDSMGQSSYIVQTVENPKIEFNITVLSGGVEYSIDQILSTFKFTN